MYRCFIILLLSCTVKLGYVQPDYEPTVNSEIRERLQKKTGMDWRQMGINPTHVELSTSCEITPFLKVLFENPFDAPDAMHRFLSVNKESERNLGLIALNASILLNHRAGSFQYPEWRTEIPVMEDWIRLFDELQSQSESSVSTYSVYESSLKLTRLSKEAQIIIFEYLQSIHRASTWIKICKKSIVQYETLTQSMMTAFEFNHAQVFELRDLLKEFDFAALMNAACEFNNFISQTANYLNKNECTVLQESIAINTPYGVITVAGQENTEHENENPPLLLLDTGGDDYYKGAYAKSNVNNPFSLVIDLSGSDHYESTEENQGNGSSFLGCSGLIDWGDGDDVFQGNARCFGYAFMGSATLFNASGHTVYETESYSLGSAEKGISVMIDQSGNDLYQSIFASQGYGGYGGFGMIQDSQGNDRYIASATPLVVASAQLPDQNFSASQGFGTGRLGYMNEGVSLSGGIGLLLDEEGNDEYQASVFAQGAGYGFGIGCLADFEGNDRYSASWYAMGAAAHQAAGFLFDEAGNDLFENSHYMACGAATDLSLGIMIENHGNDNYLSKNSSFGCSYDNSFTLFIELSGNDTYQLSGIDGFGFGENLRSSSLRGLWDTFSFFADSNGSDSYSKSFLKNEFQWNEKPSPPKNMNVINAGIDL